MSYILRDYQAEAVDAVISHIRKHTTSCCIDAATGGGKSLIIAEIAKRLMAMSGKKTLVLAPSKELVEQDFDKYSLTGNVASFYSASVGIKSTRHPVVFGTPQTVTNGIDKFMDGFAAVIIDECHMTTPTLRNIVGQMRIGNPNLRVIGMTATPYRLGDGYIYQLGINGEPMPPETITSNPDKQPFFAKLVYRISTRQLIDRGYLTQPEFYDGGIHYAAGGLETNARGQFDAGEIAATFEGKGRLTADIVADAISRSQPGLGVMFFAASIQHAHEICESLPESQTELVTGETKKSDRERILKAFKSGDLRYLVNVSVLTTGFDAPNVGTVAILRATESPGLLLQIIGRGLRLYDGKDKVMILDYAENLIRHAPAGDVFDPEVRSKSSTTGEKIPAICPECGFENQFGGKPNPDQFAIDGNGYFLTTLGEHILNETGKPIAAHMGQRCHGLTQTAHDVIQCSYRWNSRECPECGGENSLSARECVHCGQELIDPNEKLSLKNELKAQKARAKSAWTTSNVVAWHARNTANATEIAYTIDGGKVITEYLCPMHAKDWVSRKAKRRCIKLGINFGGDIAKQINGHGDNGLIKQHMAVMPLTITWRKPDGAQFYEVQHD